MYGYIAILYGYVEIYWAAQSTEDELKKNISFHEGNKLYAFLANLDEINADLAQFTKRWN